MRLGHQSSSQRRLAMSAERPSSTLPVNEHQFSHKTDRIVASLTGNDSPAPRSHNASGRTSPRQMNHLPEDKIDLLKSLLREKTMKIDDLMLENELLRSKAEIACRERDTVVQDCRMLKSRIATLTTQLVDYRTKLIRYKDFTLYSPSTEQLQKAQRYCDFIDMRLQEFPAFQQLFRDRTEGAEAFSELLKTRNHFHSFVTCLQLIADLIVMQSDDSREPSVGEISDLPISPIEATSRVQSFVTRAEDEYEKMVDESRRLRRKIDHQSLRIAALSQQMALRLGSKLDVSPSFTLPSDFEVPQREHSARGVYSAN